MQLWMRQSFNLKNIILSREFARAAMGKIAQLINPSHVLSFQGMIEELATFIPGKRWMRLVTDTRLGRNIAPPAFLLPRMGSVRTGASGNGIAKAARKFAQ